MVHADAATYVVHNPVIQSEPQAGYPAALALDDTVIT
jgi:hypothetical protein